MDREWWQVESADGRVVRGGNSPLPNKEAAVTLARSLAEENNDPLIVVKYTRREIRRFQRAISVDETDVSSPSATPVP